jgi:hypothetical protein
VGLVGWGDMKRNDVSHLLLSPMQSQCTRGKLYRALYSVKDLSDAFVSIFSIFCFSLWFSIISIVTCIFYSLWVFASV